MKRLYLFFSVTTALALAAAGCANGLAGPVETYGTAGTSEAARLTLAKIRAFNDISIDAGQLAQNRSANQSVRDFGDVLVNDHRLADRWVGDVVESENITLGPVQNEAMEEVDDLKERVDDLTDVVGQEFEVPFLTTMLEANSQMIKDLGESLRQISNAEVRELIENIRPLLQEHEQMASKLLLEQERGPAVGQRQEQTR